ncbi:GNAT family N-acetyltransferase [Rhizobiaceae bacterium CRRU44]|uniref:GNAT family N-acetyltransferase n=1 Tax=Ferranicluibacter rubi TaxID=2715133 RepID=A0AA43ZGH9_9HYPH|nr:GNAT family N-acetyltransferase [Ferranicluibacter rubi]NHT76462.1 GNAT family N-acetyltransferase [Ferranicluibacter rubi]
MPDPSPFSHPHADRRLPEGLRLRAAEQRDVAGITELSNLPLYRAGTQRLPFQSEDVTARWLGSGGEAASTVVVAELDGRIVGLGGLHRQTGRRQHVAILGLGVHDDFQRLGIGVALLDALLDAAFNWLQIRRVELTVFSDNAGAIALYERAGFRGEGLLRAYAFRNGAYADVIAMARMSWDLGFEPAQAGS